MIELKEAQAEMERMMHLEFGPRGREQRQEVLKCICQARTVLILQGAVTSWLEQNPKFPKPAEIRTIIASLNVSHDEAIETQRRREEWAEAKAYAGSPRGRAEAKQDLIDLRALFVQRLASVDERHAANEGGERERERIKGQIRKMIAHIDAGKTIQQIVGAEPYHGEF
jgi:hypothetical protein